MTVTGIEIDPTKSYDYSIYFSGGSIVADSFSKNIEPFMMNIDETNYDNTATWDIRYDTSGVHIVPYPYQKDCLQGESIGGFVYVRCGLNLLNPFDDCVVYTRAFDDSFSTEYYDINNSFNICTDKLTEFNTDFDADFAIDLT